MCKFILKVNIIFITITLLYLLIAIPHIQFVHATQMYDDPGTSSSDTTTSNYNDAIKILLKFMSIDSDGQNNTAPTPTPIVNLNYPTPFYTPYDGATPSDASPAPSSSIIPYRQCDYAHVPMYNGCNICKVGCGITSVSIALSNYGINADPIAVENQYQLNGFYAGCDGTYLYDAKRILELYGLKTSNYIFASNTGYKIDLVAQDVRDKVKNGWIVFALAKFCNNGCRHFFIITDIDSSNRVTSYDPYYEPDSRTQPINYQARYPFPIYEYAFGIKKL